VTRCRPRRPPAGVGYTSLGREAKYVRPITRDTGRVLCLILEL
jgi:hypothetical protein